jgi:5-methylcytosine-specific restriction endonuclease McrA
MEKKEHNMPYKDHSKQKEFQRKWVAKRRSDHFKGKKCANCGKPITAKTAELDHKTAKMNRTGHKIWSREKKDRDKEIKKTQILCTACHKKKTAKQAADRAEDIFLGDYSAINEGIEKALGLRARLRLVDALGKKK